MEENPDCLYILGGDLNTNLPSTDKKEKKLFEKILRKGCISVRDLDPDNQLISSQPTWANRSHRRIDHILLSTFFEPSGLRADHYPDLSDHSSLCTRIKTPFTYRKCRVLTNPSWRKYESILRKEENLDCSDIGLWIDKAQEILVRAAERSRTKENTRLPT